MQPDLPPQAYIVHALALIVSLVVGGGVTGRIVRGLRLVNDDLARPGPIGAGTVIGYAERLIAYLAVSAGAYEALAALVAIKTMVRYPEISKSVRARGATEGDANDPHGGRFAEYYLVGTLCSLAWGIACPAAARLLVAWRFGP